MCDVYYADVSEYPRCNFSSNLTYPITSWFLDNFLFLVSYEIPKSGEKYIIVLMVSRSECLGEHFVVVNSRGNGRGSSKRKWNHYDGRRMNVKKKVEPCRKCGRIIMENV